MDTSTPLITQNVGVRLVMGHYILGFSTDDTENEISCLERGAFNGLNTAIYEALDCREYNGGSSGNGNRRKFSKGEITKAMEHLGTNEDYGPERAFLSDCLSNVDRDGNIVIGFY